MSNLNMGTVELGLDAGLPLVLWGSPGIGKTAQVRQAAAERGWPVLEVIASRRAPEDFGGWPVPSPEGLRFEPGAGFREFAVAAELAEGGILFLDEVSCAPPAVQAALLTLILDKRIGDWALPDCIRVVAAANPPDQAAGGWDLAAPAANRLMHLDWATPTVEQWTDWLLQSSVRARDEGTPWAGGAGAKARGVVSGFLSKRPSLLLQLPVDDVARGRAWPSPRSWEAACRLLAAGMAAGAPEAVVEAGIIGCLGSGPGIELSTYARELDLPDPEEVLRDPSSWTPDRARADRTLATLAAVVAAFTGKMSQPRYQAAWKVMARACDGGQAGVAATAGRSLAKIGKIRSWKPPVEAGALFPILKAAGLTF